MAYGGVVQHRPARGGRTTAMVRRAPVAAPKSHVRAPGKALVGVRPGRGFRPGAINVNPIINDAPLVGYVPPQYALGDSDDDFAQFGGFSLKGIAKAVKKVASPVQKVAAKVGHTVGNVVTSKVGQGILGTALAVTGVGAPAAAGIFAATKGVGNLIKPGGNIKHAVTGAAQGAVEGVVAAGAGKAVRKVASAIRNRGASAVSPAAKQAANSALVDKIAGTALPGVQITPSNIGPSVEDMQAQVQAQADAAAAAAQAQMAQSAAEAARAEQARQVAELQAQLQQAQQAANDAAAQQLRDQLDNANKQLAAAQQAAQAAQTASQSVQQQGASGDTSQLQALVDAATKAAQAAQAAASAPPVPQATAAVQQAAQQASDAAGDAAAGSPTTDEASMTPGGVSPALLIGGAVVLALVLGGKKRRSRSA